MHLTQSEADLLLEMKKVRINEDTYAFPSPGSKTIIPIISEDKRENFILHMYRGSINLAKGTYQNRARGTVVLVRLDLGGPPHCNPDGEEIASPHIHIYRQGYDDKWATPIPDKKFSNLDDLRKTLDEFMNFCNIIKPPIIQHGLL